MKRGQRTNLLTVPMILRAVELATKADISYGAIARILAMDYDRPVTDNQVRHALRQRGIRREAKTGVPFTATDSRKGHGRQRTENHSA